MKTNQVLYYRLIFYVISSKGCTDKADILHFDTAGCREPGKWYVTKCLR